MSEVFTVFYSWQSDTPRRHGRDLIREALDIAGDAISSDSTVPYRVLIQSDTENEPGLCNIPDTILRRLRESDAVVSDLTFVAMTDAEDRKHCSNPNVLFELGYTFASVGPERLICVMNEAHGPAAKQIFDLAHHRRPIPFQSPRDNTTRSETVRSLARQLEVALRGVANLGLTGGYGGDDAILHQRHLSEIEFFWRSTGNRRARATNIAIWARPKLFRPRRWPDAETLEALLRDIGPRTDRFHQFPPQRKGNAPMDWGLYNDMYGDPWAMTRAGQFWASIDVGAHAPLKLSERDRSVSPERPDTDTIAEDGWIQADQALAQMATVFQLIRNLTQRFADSELIEVGFEAVNTGGKWLHFGHWESMGPCKAPKLRREIQDTAVDFRQRWADYFAEIGKDFCDLFCRDGRVLSRDDVKSFINATGNF